MTQVTLTIIVPEAHIIKANHYGMTVGYSVADSKTYGPPIWEDALGNLYSIASLEASLGFFDLATGPLERPLWDTTEVVDLTLAQEAQALVTIWQTNLEGDTPPQVTPNVILALVGNDPHSLIQSAGLTLVETQGIT